MNSRYADRESVKTLGSALLKRENEIISELRSFKTDTRNNFKVVNAKLDGMDDKLNSLEDSNKQLTGRMDKLDGRMDKLDTSFSELKSMIQIILDRKALS